MQRATLLSLLLAVCGAAQAELVTRTIDYRVGDSTMRGYLAYDDASEGRRPAVLVAPEWWGLNDYVRSRAEQLADMGYLAFAVDMYGDGRSTEDPKQAAAWATQAKEGGRLRQRINAGLEVLAAQPLADVEQMAAIGFCFGGTAVLELAYSGAPVSGVVSFHGNLPVPQEDDLSRIKASLLVLHGADDPHVPPAQVAAFEAGMRRAKADWHMVIYGGAQHAFSNPEADAAGLPGVAYDELAAERAWSHMQSFFAELFRPF